MLVESEDRVARAVQVALVESEDPVEPAVLELETGPAAEPELGIVPVAELELETVPVAVELEHGQVVAVPELVQVPAELEHVRAAVPLRTKSVITPHHRGLVPLLGAEEDLAAAEVETTREPAATEAVIAWEVAE